MHFFRNLVQVLLFAVGTIRALAAEPEPRDLSEKVENLRGKYNLPACAAAIVQKGKITAIGASGLRRTDRDVQVTIEDIWSIGSCTKSMTATVVGMLVDSGKVAWETRVPAALPRFACNRGWREVTVWDLVTHRSGLGQVWFPENNPVFAPLLPGEQREAFVRSLVSQPLPGPPGKSAYSNAGYTILGEVIERLSGENYEKMLRECIFKPLNLESAGFGAPAGVDRPNQPYGHRRKDDRLLPVEPSAQSISPLLAPAASVHMSLTDFARYAAWLGTNSPPLLKPETFARLHTPPEGDKYAGGIWKTEMPGIGGEAFCHTGTIGGFFAVMYINHDCACVAVMNVEGFGWEWLGDEIVAAAMESVR